MGGRPREYHVLVEPAKLNSYSMPLTKVGDAIRNSNTIMPAGMIQENYHLYLTTVTGLKDSKEQIENTVVDVVKGTPVLGKIFERNWELLSFLIPIFLVKGIVKTHFRRKVADVVFVNLSRLASQWEEVVNASLLELEKDSIRQLEALRSTIEKLVTAAELEAPRIREDLNRLNEATVRVHQ